MTQLIDDPAIDARVLCQSVGARMSAYTLVELPEPWNMRDEIEFVAGAVERDGARHPGADALVRLLVSADGKEVLRRHGFLPL